MTRLATVICLVLAAVSARAQISPQSITLAAVSDCIREAIGAGTVEPNGAALIFSCTAAKAKALYGFLGRTVQAQVVQEPNGRFENRPFGNSACYHRVQDQTGKAADDFRCDLIIVVGDALNN
jgi:hypothetical protein